MLLPLRDAESTLPACLRSLSRQTLADHEVVAVDDGSRDGTGRLLAVYARRDPRLRVVSTPARGLVPALNRALAEARAPLLARIDGDDVAHRERLARQAARMRDEAELAILGCRVRLLGGVSGGGNEGMRAYVRWQNSLLEHDAITRDILVESPLVHPSVMMRRDALTRLGGYRALDGPEDYDLWLRAHAAGLRFAKLRDCLLSWRDSALRLTRRSPRYAPERFLALKLDALERGMLADRRGIAIWGCGPIGKAWSRELRARGHALAAFVEVAPRKLGQVVHGVPVVSPAAIPEGVLHLAAVGQPGARRRIRLAAARLGLVEGRSFIAVA